MKNDSYSRAFCIGLIWFALIAVKMDVSHQPDGNRRLAILAVAWLITALLVGTAAKHLVILKSWLGIGVSTAIGSIAVLGIMLFTVEHNFGKAGSREFKTTDEMMVYFADQARQWVKADRNVSLDYSLESISVIEDQLAKLEKEVNKTNPQQGTRGTAIGYGAYIGEVFRRREGGSWAKDHDVGGQGSFPLALAGKSNVIFPVGWCWKRLTGDDSENVYIKAKMVLDADAIVERALTNKPSK